MSTLPPVAMFTYRRANGGHRELIGPAIISLGEEVVEEVRSAEEWPK